MRAGKLACKQVGFVNHNFGISNTLLSNRILLQAGGIGIIVINDPLRPTDPDEFADYVELITFACGEFEVVILDNTIACPIKNGVILENKKINLALIDQMVIEQYTIERETYVRIKVPRIL